MVLREEASYIRGQGDFEPSRQYGRAPIPVGIMESASEVVKHFRTGAMSQGSISVEARTLAIALNRLGKVSSSVVSLVLKLTRLEGREPIPFDSTEQETFCCSLGSRRGHRAVQNTIVSLSESLAHQQRRELCSWSSFPLQDLYEIVHVLVEALSLLQMMSKGHASASSESFVRQRHRRDGSAASPRGLPPRQSLVNCATFWKMSLAEAVVFLNVDARYEKGLNSSRWSRWQLWFAGSHRTRTAAMYENNRRFVRVRDSTAGGCRGRSPFLPVESFTKSIPAVKEGERVAFQLCSRSSITLEEDLHKFVHDLVDAPCPLQTMSKGHENHMATIESMVLLASQDEDSVALERLQSVEFSIAALSESVARQQAAVGADRLLACW